MMFPAVVGCASHLDLQQKEGERKGLLSGQVGIYLLSSTAVKKSVSVLKSSQELPPVISLTV